MKPVTQTRFGWPGGNCVAASYATILGMPIDAVPRFDPGSGAIGEEQGRRERAWLRSIGLGLVEISTDPEESLSQEVLDCIPPIEHLMSGISPRGYGHRVVGIGGRVAFDPHPSRAGLVSVYSIGLLVPLEGRCW